MDNDFHSRAIKLAKYEDLRPAAYGVISTHQHKQSFLLRLLEALSHVQEHQMKSCVIFWIFF